MNRYRLLLLFVALAGFIWASVQNAAGNPFDALVTVVLSGLLMHESYRDDRRG